MILGVVSLAWAIAWGLYFRNNPGEHRGITQRGTGEVAALRGARAERKRHPVPWGPLTRRMLPVTIVYFCYGWTLWLYLAWIPQFFLHSYHLNLAKSALFAAGVFFAGVVGDALGGIASDSSL